MGISVGTLGGEMAALSKTTNYFPGTRSPDPALHRLSIRPLIATVDV